MWFVIRFCAVFSITVTIIMACTQSSSPETSDPKSLVKVKAAWQDASHIPVCIVSTDDVSEDLLNSIQSHVDHEFSTKTDVGFSGWHTCQDKDYETVGIRLYLHRKHDWTKDRIKAGGGVSKVGPTKNACKKDCNGGTMRVNIGLTGAYPTGDNYQYARDITESTALHEFGHAVGLMHEHVRTDAVDCDKGTDDQLIESDTYVYIGDYDKESVMNYCRDRQRFKFLSAGDVEGIQFLYGEDDR
ncbi:MAG: hypothetical protein HRU19_24970 [Pseudobacteriovorax sp.]|nr:hypothetical protein [Pseudobacteriovorax sp.]